MAVPPLSWAVQVRFETSAGKSCTASAVNESITGASLITVVTWTSRLAVAVPSPPHIQVPLSETETSRV
ncbi:MAG: hypothetical protein GY856_21065 [bacterium]|nr:hypothetical protein [bacterium]